MVNKTPDPANKTVRMVVETLGDYMLSDVTVEQVVESDRPSVVFKSPFIDQRVAAGQLNVVEPSTDLSDEQLMKVWREGNYKNSKKQPKEPPQAVVAGVAADPSSVPPPVPAPVPTGDDKEPREQNPNEDDDAYLKYLDDWKKAHPKKGK